jgi:hypothetical protein
LVYIDSTTGLLGDEKQNKHSNKQPTMSSFRIENPSSCFVSFSWGHASPGPRNVNNFLDFKNYCHDSQTAIFALAQ